MPEISACVYYNNQQRVFDRGHDKICTCFIPRLMEEEWLYNIIYWIKWKQACIIQRADM